MRFHKIVVTFFTAFFLLATLGSFSLCAEEELIKGKPTLPGKSCQTEPLPNWTPQEKWVWKQVCEGKIANFNKTEGYGGNLDPKKPEEWPESRILTPVFLETILLHEPFRGSLTRHGVRIVGAWFKDPIDLSNATLDHQLELEDSRFDKDVDLGNLKTTYLISLNRSKFNGTLIMDSLEVESHLFMSGGAEFHEVDLRSAKIGGQIDMTGSKFTGTLVMGSLEVESGLFMRGGAEFHEVDLRSAKIGGQIDMAGSKFTGTLVMDSLEVESHLFMSGGAEFHEVDLRSA
ncbi:MAG: hypothetical protein JYX80_13325, partial [Candidatus Scalindua sediminis]|nr:hypothetical protein [Candidatus Scalindua sediminis]